MNRDLDAEIAAALEAEAAAHDMPAGAWSRLADRMEGRAPRGRGLIALATLVAVIALLVTLAANVRDDDAGVVTGNSGTCAHGAAIQALTRSDAEFNPGSAEVVVAEGDGSFRTITGGWYAAADPSFAPDGARVALVRTTPDYEEPSTMEIWLVATDGTDRRRLTTGFLDSDPSWSPDGSQIAFRRLDRDTRADQLMTVPAAGGTATPLLALDGRSVQAPSWSPDGTKLAFASGQANGPFDQLGDEVWVTEAAGPDANPRAIARVSATQQISWYPTGDALLVSTLGLEEGTVSRVDLADGTVTRLLAGATQAALAADGATTYFVEAPEGSELGWRRASGRVAADSIALSRSAPDPRLRPYEFYGADVSRCTPPTPPSQATTEPALPALDLTRSGGCGDGYFWLATEDGATAVTFGVDLRDRATDGPTTATFDLPQEEVTATVIRGVDLTRNFCTDMIDMDSEPRSTSPIRTGHAEMTLDPPGPCGSTHGRITITGFVAADGTVVPDTSGDTDGIGCYSG